MAFSHLHKHIVIQPQNCLNSQTSSILQKQFAEIAPDRYKLWVIDMTDVDFIDSSGLCTLVGGLNIARHQGCRLVICNLSSKVRLIFEITQLVQLFEIFDSFEEVIVEGKKPFDLAQSKREEAIKSISQHQLLF
ncbi:STAS domain-containing protein [Tychonema sp. BBK16]|uniref:STAS domain-containing protein n=1 Tax=Tychonema sp. BBK16 TaxID=2699888 RepID=UPI001F33711C|nr:STAS domain-containing protein [Tychonema sp. BBK16]MCF6374210.1 STAS domain-containing protein [Tychonema sp. BBK16]